MQLRTPIAVRWRGAALLVLIIGGCSENRMFGPAGSVPRAISPLNFRYVTGDSLNAVRQRVRGSNVAQSLAPSDAFASAGSAVPHSRAQNGVAAPAVLGASCNVSGDAACAISDISIDGSGWTAFAETYSPIGLYMPMYVFGAGRLARGTSIFGWVPYSLSCILPYTDACADSDAFSDTCDEERNSMNQVTNHRVFFNLQQYSRTLSDSDSCEPPGGGGPGPGEPECTTEQVIIEVWHDDHWDFWGYDYVEVCT